MNKIPVWRTISQTYGFAISRYLPLLGVTWLPFLLMGVLGYFYLIPALLSFADMMPQLAPHTGQPPQMVKLPPGFGQSLSHIYAFVLAAFVLMSLIAVGVAKEALGLRRGLRFVYIAFGKSELFFMGGIFLVLMLFYVALFVIGIIGAIAAVVAVSYQGPDVVKHVDPVQLAANIQRIVFPIMSVAELVFSYFLIRLTYLMVPVTVAEGRFGLWRSWHLTKGNFWRIAGVLIGTLLPFFVVQFAISWLAFGPEYFEFAIRAQINPLGVNAQMPAMMRMMVHGMTYMWPVSFVLAPLSNGLMFGQSAFAYRSLVPDSGQAKG